MSKRYLVNVCRSSWCEFEVEADNIEDVQRLAMDKAVNHSWVSEEAEYAVDSNYYELTSPELSSSNGSVTTIRVCPHCE